LKKDVTSEVKVREALHDDLEKVYEIETQSFKDPYSLTFLKFLYQANRRTYLVGERENVVIGYVIASIDRDMGHILSIAISPLERRKKVGKRLMEVVLNILYSIGAHVVRLEVRQSNIEACKFYEDLGFQPSYTVQKYYGEEDAIIYFKTLSSTNKVCA